MKKIYIYGAGGHGLVVGDIALALDYDVVFIDDGDSEYQSFEDVKNDTNTPMIIGIGDNKIRQDLFNKATRSGFDIVSLIHPSSIISPSSIIEKGTVVMPNVVVNAKSIVGKCVILNTSCVIEHENIIKDFVHISPNVALAGNVTVDKSTHIGIGSSVIEGIEIGKENIIAANSTIIKNTNDNDKLAGTPARKIN